MFQVQNGSKNFGPKTLFENLDWMITPGEKVGIVGGNGTGKSTLLKILAGIESLEKGSVNRAKGATIGYLPQEGLMHKGRTVFNECLSVFDKVRDMEREMDDLAHKMGELDPSSAEYDAVTDRFHELQTRFATFDGYSLDAKVGAVLAGLQFPKDDWTRNVEEFSGGWQMRVALAKLLLEQPDLLLLDEPTNHLDLEARNWLEEYLKDYPAAFVLISHDRYFLDVTVNRIVEIWNKRVHFYPGNYEKYLAQKTERIEQIRAAWINQNGKIEQLESFINRFRAQATKAKQVQSRIKELERMERVEAPPPEEKTIHFSFPQPKASGRIVAEFKGVAKAYGSKHVFAGVDFVIERGDKIALVGHNGTGKSTLIKLLAGVEPLTAGDYTLGHNVAMEYFAQDQYKELDPTASLIDDIGMHATRAATQTELRNLLGCFLFSEDDVYKKMGVLSGGERNRYALARLLLRPANFLLLDEPTNHLDMRAKDVLLHALETYTGTVVFVSHDRYFLDRLATRVFEVGDGEVRIFPGNYEDYMWRISGAHVDLSLQTKAPEPVEAPAPAAAPSPVNGSAAPAKRVNPMKTKQLEKRQKEIEQNIAALESKIAADEAALAVYVSAEESQRLADSAAAARSEVEKLTEEWESVVAELETVAVN